ncbi:MAG: helix-turn-helix transcriptional regulator [Deltaproteobacteria bacterium]|nr:helix-turn-helix transcriptional regulator [Deltaproteobacteria bacterium]
MAELRVSCWSKDYPGDRPPRFLRAFLLFFLLGGESHGYDLIERLKRIGVKYENYEVGYIYKILRTMEEEGLLESRWNIKEKGVARRIYTITEKGKKNLEEWVETLSHLKESLDAFLKSYKEYKSKEQQCTELKI